MLMVMDVGALIVKMEIIELSCVELNQWLMLVGIVSDLFVQHTSLEQEMKMYICVYIYVYLSVDAINVMVKYSQREEN